MDTVIGAFTLFCLGSYFSYTPSIRTHWSYIPLTIGISILGGALWAWTARRCADNKEVLFWSLVWDALMVAAYYALPLFFGSAKIPFQAYVAAGLAIFGLIWFKSLVS